MTMEQKPRARLAFPALLALALALALAAFPVASAREPERVGGCVLAKPAGAVPDDNPYTVQTGGPTGPFTKSVTAFGLGLFTGFNSEVSDSALCAIAGAVAEMFPENVKDPAAQAGVLRAMWQLKAGFPVFQGETRPSGDNRQWDNFADSHSTCDSFYVGVERDGQVMEIVEHALHAITNVGLHAQWPAVWGLSRNSRLWKEMNVAIKLGVYDTSDYRNIRNGSGEKDRILMQEFAYFLISSAWGIQEAHGPNSKEWTARTPAALRSRLPGAWEMYEATVQKVMAAPSAATLQLLKRFAKGDTEPTVSCPSTRSSGDKCSPVMCAMHCEHGFVKDNRGCDMCKCEKCSPVMCAMHCEHGFVKDSQGCDMCKCAKPPTPTPPPSSPPTPCKPVLCKLGCKHGWAKGEDGCDMCKCAKPPPCKPVTCKMFCKHGWAKDEDGCDMCKCAKPPAGNQKGEACGPGSWTGFTPGGDFGECAAGLKCECVGMCADPRVADAPSTCVDADACTPVLCKMHCEHGWAKGDDGCDMCKCAKPPPCKPVLCDMFCEHGWAKGDDGCDMCKCANPPKPVCSEIVGKRKIVKRQCAKAKNCQFSKFSNSCVDKDLSGGSSNEETCAAIPLKKRCKKKRAPGGKKKPKICAWKNGKCVAKESLQ